MPQLTKFAFIMFHFFFKQLIEMFQDKGGDLSFRKQDKIMNVRERVENFISCHPFSTFKILYEQWAFSIEINNFVGPPATNVKDFLIIITPDCEDVEAYRLGIMDNKIVRTKISIEV